MNIKKRFKKIIKTLYLQKNRLHFKLQVKKDGKFFKIVLNEKYKKTVKYTKYTLTLLGLITSLLIFPSIIYSFLFALALLGIQTLAEQTIFSYITVYMQALPNFEIENNKWLGMSFGYAVNPEKTMKIPVVGMLLSDVEYARNIHNLISTWTRGSYDDKDKNVKASVILKNKNEYVFFVFPSPDSAHVQGVFREVEKERKTKSLTDVQMKHFVQLVLGKGCEITQNSFLPEFVKMYEASTPFYFQTLVYKNGNAHQVKGLSDFILYDLKIKKESDLTRKDMEYDVLRIFKLNE